MNRSPACHPARLGGCQKPPKSPISSWHRPGRSACSGRGRDRRCRPRGRPPPPGRRAGRRTRCRRRPRSGRSAAARARPGASSGSCAGSGDQLVAAARDHVAAHPAGAALELGLAGGEQRPGQDRGRPVGQGAADQPLVGRLADRLPRVRRWATGVVRGHRPRQVADVGDDAWCAAGLQSTGLLRGDRGDATARRVIRWHCADLG